MGIRVETFGDKFMLLEEYEIKGYIIPKGFVTDFATIFDGEVVFFDDDTKNIELAKALKTIKTRHVKI